MHELDRLSEKKTQKETKKKTGKCTRLNWKRAPTHPRFNALQADT